MAAATVKTPPYSEEAEKSVLGCMLLDKDAAITALNILSADDFYIDRNKWIFNILGDISREGYAIDSVTIITRLKNENLFENIGASYIAELQEIVPSTKNIEQYCRIVSDKAALRSIIINFNNIINECYESKKSLREIIDEAEKFIYNTSMNTSRGSLQSLKEVLLPALIRIAELHAAGNEFTGVATGISGLDTLTNGLQKSDLILLAARPSVGKTALALNIAANAAIRGGKSVAFFSLEMSCEQLVMRIMASENQINSMAIRAGRQTSAQWKKLTVFNNEIAASNVRYFMDDTSSISTGEVRSRLRKLKSMSGLDLVIIDYLQLMTTSSRTNNREQEISAISRELKAIAKELEVPVLALAQLSRNPEKRSDARPILSDLRESGAIEQDADVVMMLYKNSKHEENADPELTELIIAKHRNGETGTVKLSFLSEYTKFVDYRGES